MKFRKKPVVIEAFRISIDPWPDWFCSKYCSNKVTTHDTDKASIYAIINTLEGKMKADPGDWIIQGVDGEIYPCKPDIFEKTYEKCE